MAINSISFNPKFSRGVLGRLIILALLVGAAIAASAGFVDDFYFRRQITPVGLAINSGIVLLFSVGMIKLVATLLRYQREERALGHFLEAVELQGQAPIAGLPDDSLIVRRYEAIRTLRAQHAVIDHAALAATLQANESTRTTLPRFINNILILTGVFGTIVSLSISLIGASNLLGSPGEMGEMGLVVHGMSTALSTTLTAIVCYLFFGYFYLKVADAQTHLLSGIEQVTSLYLVPQVSYTKDSVIQEVGQLIRELRETAREMRAVQSGYAEAARHLVDVISQIHPRVELLGADVRKLKRIMREGFRLPDEGDDR